MADKNDSLYVLRATLKVKFRAFLTDTKLMEQLKAEELSNDAKIFLLSSKIGTDRLDELPLHMMLAQETLVEAGILPNQSHFAYQPKPQQLHKQNDAGRHLATHAALREFLYRQCALLADDSHHDPATDLHPGLLVLALVLEGGALSKAELCTALQSAANNGIRAMGSLHYLQVPSSYEGGHTQDSRRLHISDLILVLLLRMTMSSLHMLASDPSAALVPIAKSMGRQRLSLTEVTNAASAHLEHCQRIPLWLLSWMRHNSVYSSSLVEDSWLRLNRYRVPRASDVNDSGSRPASGRSAEDDGANTNGEYNPEVELHDPISPLADDPIFGKIGRILRQGHNDPALTRLHIQAMEPAFRELATQYPAAGQLFQWLLSLHDKFTKASTIRLNFFAVAHRLLALCGTTPLHELTQDDLSLLVDYLQEDGLSASTQGNVAGALNHLIRFLNRSYGTSFTPVPAGMAVAIANARVLSPPEVKECIDYLSSARSRLPANHRRAAQDLVLLNFQTGLRRQEALHLERSRIVGDPAILCIRNTENNRLKSNASVRDIPSALLHRHSDVINHALRPDDTELLIHPQQTMKSLPLSAGTDAHRLFCEALVRDVHDTFRAITGDSKLTLHSLRHSCATTSLLLLLAKRFRLHELTDLIPYLRDVLTPEAEQLVRNCLCPTAYTNDGELAAIRDLLGHSSEIMTLAHYVHVLDILRLASVRQNWTNDKFTIARTGGYSDYMIQKHGLPELLDRLAARSEITVTSFEYDDQPPYSLESDDASRMVREMTAVSLRYRNEDELGNLLAKAGATDVRPEEIRRYMERCKEIEPLAIRFLSNKHNATSLREIAPISRWRKEAIFLCETILANEIYLTDDDRNYNRQVFAADIRLVLENALQIGSSIVSIKSENDLYVVRTLCYRLLGSTIEDQDFFIWKKSGTTHKRQAVSVKKVLSQLGRKHKPIPGLCVRIITKNPHKYTKESDQRPSSRSYLATLSWVMACYYILYG